MKTYVVGESNIIEFNKFAYINQTVRDLKCTT